MAPAPLGRPRFPCASVGQGANSFFPARGKPHHRSTHRVGYGPAGMAEAVKIVVLEGDQTGQELLEQSLRLLEPGLLVNRVATKIEVWSSIGSAA